MPPRPSSINCQKSDNKTVKGETVTFNCWSNLVFRIVMYTISTFKLVEFFLFSLAFKYRRSSGRDQQKKWSHLELVAHESFHIRVKLDICNSSRNHDYQEPITRSVQLPHIPLTAFSQTDLYHFSLNLPRIQTPT